MSHGHNSGGIVLRNNDGTAMTREEVIILRRGYFRSLPVLCSNDLVHGSWWFFWGSLISAAFAVIPLIQQYESFYHQHDDLLPAADFVITWALLIVSGVFFALGSLAFVRAFDEPPKRPLFYWFKHLQTDELLGAWFFLLGTAPALPYSIVFFSVSPSFTYMGLILVSILFLVGCILFVMACYPNDKKIENYLMPLCLRTFGSRMWIVKHLANDWLAGTWFIYWANAFVTFVSALFFIVACNNGAAEPIFIWLSGTVVSGLFLIGSAYFVAGSYPHAQRFYYVTDKGEKMASRAPPGASDESEEANDNGSGTRNRRVSFDLETGQQKPTPIVAAKRMEGRQLDQGVVNPLHGDGKVKEPHTPNADGKTSGKEDTQRKEKKKKRVDKKDLGTAKFLATTTTLGLPPLQVPHAPLSTEEEQDYVDEEDDL